MRFLTAAILPETETAAIERLDCRREFLNIVKEFPMGLRQDSLRMRCN